MKMSRQEGTGIDRAGWWMLKRSDFLETRALLMDEGVRNVKAILVAKDGIERGTTLVPIGKHAQDGPAAVSVQSPHDDRG